MEEVVIRDRFDLAKLPAADLILPRYRWESEAGVRDPKPPEIVRETLRRHFSLALKQGEERPTPIELDKMLAVVSDAGLELRAEPGAPMPTFGMSWPGGARLVSRSTMVEHWFRAVRSR